MNHQRTSIRSNSPRLIYPPPLVAKVHQCPHCFCSQPNYFISQGIPQIRKSEVSIPPPPRPISPIYRRQTANTYRPSHNIYFQRQNRDIRIERISRNNSNQQFGRNNSYGHYGNNKHIISHAHYPIQQIDRRTVSSISLKFQPKINIRFISPNRLVESQTKNSPNLQFVSSVEVEQPKRPWILGKKPVIKRIKNQGVHQNGAESRNEGNYKQIFHGYGYNISEGKNEKSTGDELNGYGSQQTLSIMEAVNCTPIKYSGGYEVERRIKLGSKLFEQIKLNEDYFEKLELTDKSIEDDVQVGNIVN